MGISEQAFAAGSDALWIYEANPIDANRSVITQTACFEKQTTERANFAEAVEQYYILLDAAIAEDIQHLKPAAWIEVTVCRAGAVLTESGSQCGFFRKLVCQDNVSQVQASHAHVKLDCY